MMCENRYRVVRVHKTPDADDQKTVMGEGDTISEALTEAMIKISDATKGFTRRERPHAPSKVQELQGQLLEEEIRIEKGTETVTEWEEVDEKTLGY